MQTTNTPKMFSKNPYPILEDVISNFQNFTKPELSSESYQAGVGHLLTLSHGIEFQKLAELKTKLQIEPIGFLKRIKKFGDFPNGALLLSGFYFLQILKSRYASVITKSMIIKIYCCCLNLAQKIVMDDDWAMKDFAYLVGMKMQGLADLEQFILNEVLNFELSFGENFVEELQREIEQSKENKSGFQPESRRKNHFRVNRKLSVAPTHRVKRSAVRRVRTSPEKSKRKRVKISKTIFSLRKPIMKM